MCGDVVARSLASAHMLEDLSSQGDLQGGFSYSLSCKLGPVKRVSTRRHISHVTHPVRATRIRRPPLGLSSVTSVAGIPHPLPLSSMPDPSERRSFWKALKNVAEEKKTWKPSNVSHDIISSLNISFCGLTLSSLLASRPFFRFLAK